MIHIHFCGMLRQGLMLRYPKPQDLWCCLQLRKLQEHVRDCGGALPQGWSVRRIRCFGDRHRALYVAPEVSPDSLFFREMISVMCLVENLSCKTSPPPCRLRPSCSTYVVISRWSAAQG